MLALSGWVLGWWRILQRSSLVGGKVRIGSFVGGLDPFLVTRNTITFLFGQHFQIRSNLLWKISPPLEVKSSKLVTVKNFDQHFPQSIQIGFWQEYLQRYFKIGNVQTRVYPPHSGANDISYFARLCQPEESHIAKVLSNRCNSLQLVQGDVNHIQWPSLQKKIDVTTDSIIHVLNWCIN